MVSRQFGRQQLAVMAGLMPFVLAVFVHAFRPSVPLAIAAPDRPALAFDQYLVDLGRVDGVATEVRGTFVFENHGTEPVEIDEVRPSCGCLSPQLSSKVIPPGETGAVILRMQPANESPGRKEFYADVIYRDPQPRETRVTFRLELPERRLAVKPRALIVYQSSDEPTKHLVTVSDSRPNPGQILSVKVSSPYAEATLLGRKITPEHGIETEIEVVVSADVPPGRHEALITIETDDPHSPQLRVPMLMHGRQPAEPAR